jgi:hypothetical protein
VTSFTLKDLEIAATKGMSTKVASPNTTDESQAVAIQSQNRDFFSSQQDSPAEIEQLKQIVKALGLRIQEELESKKQLSEKFQKELRALQIDYQQQIQQAKIDQELQHKTESRTENRTENNFALREKELILLHNQQLQSKIESVTLQLEEKFKNQLQKITTRLEQEKATLLNKVQKLESERTQFLQTPQDEEAQKKLEAKVDLLQAKRNELELALHQAQQQIASLQQAGVGQAKTEKAQTLPTRDSSREAQGLLKLLVEKKQVDEENSLLHFEKIALGKRISQLQDALAKETQNLKNATETLQARSQEANQLKSLLSTTQTALQQCEALLDTEKTLSQNRLEQINEMEVQLNHEKALAHERALKIQGLEASLFEQTNITESKEQELKKTSSQLAEKVALLQTQEEQYLATTTSFHELETAFSNKLEETTHLHQLIDARQMQFNQLKELYDRKELEAAELKNLLEETKLLFNDADHERSALLTQLESAQEQMRAQGVELQQARLSLSSLQMIKRLVKQLSELTDKEESSATFSSTTRSTSGQFFGPGEHKGDLF